MSLFPTGPELNSFLGLKMRKYTTREMPYMFVVTTTYSASSITCQLMCMQNEQQCTFYTYGPLTNECTLLMMSHYLNHPLNISSSMEVYTRL